VATLSLDKIKVGLRKKDTQIGLTNTEKQDMLNDVRGTKSKGFETLLEETKRKQSYFPQPVRVQPNLEMFSEHPEWPLSIRMAKATAADVKSWGPKIIADIKYDGVRGLVYVNPKTKVVKIYSRHLKPLPDLEKKYSDAILQNISKNITNETVFDGEIYATGQNGKLLEYGTVAGWVRNPNDAKYKSLIPTIEVFDVILFNKKDVREIDLKYRKRLLEMAVKRRDGVVLDVADTRYMKNHPRPIEWRFKAIIRGKGEGLVLKKPESEYFYGKPKPARTENPWRKLKAVDTLDLELKAMDVSPSGKAFQDYRHWVMVPSDDDNHEIKANKGIHAARFDNSFYRNFSLDMINQWKRGKLNPIGPMVDVDPKLVKFYGVRKVPERLMVPISRRAVVELFVEKMSKNGQPSGTKIVGIREDKKKGDTMQDVIDLGNFLSGVVK